MKMLHAISCLLIVIVGSAAIVAAEVNLQD